MAICEQCKTYTSDDRADHSGSFTCRHCGAPLKHAPPSATPSGKKVSKKQQKLLEGTVVQPEPDEYDPETDKVLLKKSKTSSGSSDNDVDDDDFDDVPSPQPQAPVAPPLDKKKNTLILVGVGVGSLILGLVIGLFVPQLF